MRSLDAKLQSFVQGLQLAMHKDLKQQDDRPAFLESFREQASMFARLSSGLRVCLRCVYFEGGMRKWTFLKVQRQAALVLVNGEKA